MEYIPAKTIISNYAEHNSWFGMNYNMNIYKGCSHGCIYCDSRSDCYHIENFDKVRAKKEALAIINRELKSKTRTGVIGMGAMSDPYNPFEGEFQLTRGALELMNKYGYGVGIATKSDLITRDCDVLRAIKKHSPVLAKITITTYNDELCQKIEPHVCTSSKRFEAIENLSEAGIFTGILLMPILPFINDTEENIVNIVRRAKESGARFIFNFGMGMTLRQNQRDYYYEKLDRLFERQGLKEKYIKIYGSRYNCPSLKNKELNRIFKEECKRLGILYKMPEIIRGYKQQYSTQQISLFE